MLDKLKKYAGELGSHFTFVDYAWRIGSVACTGALSVAAAMTPWLQAAGPFGWFLIALTGTALLAVTSVPIADRFGRAWASLREGRGADHTVKELPRPGSETREERQAKHELVAFVVDYVLPACRAQWALHEVIIARLCGPMSVMEHLTLEGLKVETNVPGYLSSVDKLRKW